MPLLVVNLKQYYGQSAVDFYVLDGWPFAFFNEGGFAHDTRFIWFGLFGDLLVALLVGLAIGGVMESARGQTLEVNFKEKV